MGPAVLHAYGFNGARVNTSPAIDAGIRVNDCFAARHADGVAGAFFHTGLTTGAFRFVHFCRHASTLSNRSYESIEKARDHTALLKRLQTKISAKKSTADGLATPERTASVCRVRRGLIYGTTLRGRGGFLPQAPPWVPVERCAMGRRLSDQWDGAGSPGDHPDPSEIRGLRDSRTAAAIALTRSLGSDWAIQSRTLSNSSP